MLNTVKLINFKSHRSAHLVFDESRLHALVGQNSSGKTSILQALHYLSRLADSPCKQVFGYPREPSFLATVGQNEMAVTASGFWGYNNNQQNWTAVYRFEKQRNDNWQPKLTWTVDLDQGQMSGGWNSSFKDAPSPIPQALRHTVHLKLIASNLAKADYSEEISPRVEYDGSKLAPTLDYLGDEDPDRFNDLQEMLKRIVPGVLKIGVRRANVVVKRQRLIEVDGKSISYEENQELVGKEVVLDMNTGSRIPGHAVSEGTILTLGLLAVLLNPKQPNLVLLDDVEQGLHPKAQREMMCVFKEILAAYPNLQIVFSTHSPYIIDELRPSQVHVLSNTNAGFTVTNRLDKHPDIEWANYSLTTGEFWDAEGEDWVQAGAENA